MDALRDAGRPLTTGEITDAILDAKGHGEEARPVIRRRVTSNLAYRARRGEIARDDTEPKVRWLLVDSEQERAPRAQDKTNWASHAG